MACLEEKPAVIVNSGGKSMQTFEMFQQASSDKMLHLTIPVDEANRCYRMVIVVVPEFEAGNVLPKSGVGWPPEFFEQTAGQWQGDFVK